MSLQETRGKIRALHIVDKPGGSALRIQIVSDDVAQV
jgi:hypothetical protein